MISVHCPRHRRDVLLGLRQIRGIEGQGRDLTVRWTCWCGHHGESHPHSIS